MWTASSRTPSALITSRSRSWVKGRSVWTPCCWKAIADASTAPIQIGRDRTPSSSRSRTTGWLAGSSTRTPTTRIGCTTAPPGTPRSRRRRYTLLVAAGRPLRSRPRPRAARSGRAQRAGGPTVRPTRAPSPRPAPSPRCPAVGTSVRRSARTGQPRARPRCGRPAGDTLEAEAGQIRHDLGHGQGVVVVVAARLLADQAELLELGELVAAQPGRVQQLLAREPHRRRRRTEVLGRRRVVLDRGDGHVGRTWAVGRGPRRHQAAVDRVQLVLDDPQRQVVVALLGEHVAQPAHVTAGELPVARGRPLRLHQPLVLEEPDLADREIRKLDLQMGEHVADGERGSGSPAGCAHTRHAFAPTRTAAVR